PPYGIALILAGVGPGIWAFHHRGHDNLAALFAITCMLYVLGYEWLHLSYHLGPDSWIGRRKVIGLLRRHHATHHDPRLMQRWNFNVVVPFWDWVRGTIHRQAADAAPPGTSPPRRDDRREPSRASRPSARSRRRPARR